MYSKTCNLCIPTKYSSNKLTLLQGDHLSGKPRNVRDFTENQGNVMELSGKKSCQGKVA